MMNKKDDLRNNVEMLVEKSRSQFRDAVRLIPAIGGSLDHLVFDRFDEIRKKNIELAVEAICGQIQKMPEGALVKEWFESAEALNTFKVLIESIQFEHESGKIVELSRLFPVFGSTSFAGDPLKLAVLTHLGQMTDVSIKLLRVVSHIQPARKKLGTRGLEAVVIAAWPKQIGEALNGNQLGQFWKGTLNIPLEMQLLESKSMVHRIETVVSSEQGFRMTGFGRKTAAYLNFH